MKSIYHLEKFAILREALFLLLSSDPSVNYAGGDDNMERFEKLYQQIRIDILLLDIELCPDCLEWCKRIHKQYPALKIILHSPYRSAWWLDKFLDGGVSGFISKQSGFNELLIAISTVSTGKIYVCPEISGQFLNLQQYLADKNNVLRHKKTGFTERETEILLFLSKGHSSKAIASHLFLSEKTIETHRRKIINKAQVKNTAELINYVSVHGFLFN